MEYRDSDFQSALDGELNSGEAAQLAIHLKHPQAQQDFERLKRVDAALRNLESVAPPSGLRSEVMRQIRLRAALQETPRAKATGWLSSFWAPIRDTRPAFQLGLGFALGVLVLSPFILRPGNLVVDPGHAVGTLSRPASDLTLVLSITGSGISGELLRGIVEGTPCIELRLVADRPVEARIELGTPVGLLSWESATAPQGVRIEPGLFVVQHRGEGTYRLKLSEMPGDWPTTTVVVSAGGLPVFEETVR